MPIRGEDRLSLPALIARLTQDGLSVVRAELRLQKARIAARIAAAKTGIALIVVAVVIALLALIGLVVGVTMALATLVGPGFAGLIVAAVGLAVAAVLGWLGVRRLSARPAAVVEIVS